MKVVALVLVLLLAAASYTQALHVWDPDVRALSTFQHRAARWQTDRRMQVSVTAPLVLPASSNLDLCQAPQPGEFASRVVLVQRGQCTFVQKVKNAYFGSATAIIVGNNVCCQNIEMQAPDDADRSSVYILPPAASVNLNAYMTMRDIAIKLNSSGPSTGKLPGTELLPNAPFVMLVEPENGMQADEQDAACQERIDGVMYLVKFNLLFGLAVLTCTCCLARSRRFRRDGGAAQPGYPGVMAGGFPGAAAAAAAANPRTVYNPSGAAVGGGALAPTPFRLVPIQAAPSSYVPETAAAAAVPTQQEVVVSPSGFAGGRSGYAPVPQSDAELALLH